MQYYVITAVFLHLVNPNFFKLVGFFISFFFSYAAYVRLNDES